MMFRYRVVEFTPQIDVDMPAVRLEETECALSSYGAVYDLALVRHNGESIITTLTVEELELLKHTIQNLLDTRNNDPIRQGKKLPK